MLLQVPTPSGRGVETFVQARVLRSKNERYLTTKEGISGERREGRMPRARNSHGDASRVRTEESVGTRLVSTRDRDETDEGIRLRELGLRSSRDGRKRLGRKVDNVGVRCVARRRVFVFCSDNKNPICVELGVGRRRVAGESRGELGGSHDGRDAAVVEGNRVEPEPILSVSRSDVLC